MASLTAVAAGVNLLTEEAGTGRSTRAPGGRFAGARRCICAGLSLIQSATARGIVPAIVGFRLSAVSLLTSLAFIGSGLRPVAFATLMLAVLVALVTFEVSRNLRSDAHPSPKPSAE